MKSYLNDHGCKWFFNPPHVSHFGGAWERHIGTIRRVLYPMFAELGSQQRTHELLVTLVTAIARPISAMLRDPDEPQPLSPSMLLTMKTCPLGPPPGNFVPPDHSRPQRSRSFWSAPRIATSVQVQQRKSAIHGLPVTLHMLRVKSDKSDWFWSQSIVFTNPFKTGMSLDLNRGD